MWAEKEREELRMTPVVFSLSDQEIMVTSIEQEGWFGGGASIIL